MDHCTPMLLKNMELKKRLTLASQMTTGLNTSQIYSSQTSTCRDSSRTRSSMGVLNCNPFFTQNQILNLFRHACVANTKNPSLIKDIKLSYFKIFNNKCLRNCSDRGTCIKGKCQCNTGYTLRDCSKKATLFTLDKEPTDIEIHPG